MARRRAHGALLVALALAAAACSGRGDAPPPAAPIDAGVTKAPPDEPPAPEPERRYIAVIAAERSVDLAPKLPGELVAVRVRVGDEVGEGDIIATLDNRAAREALAMAKAELASAHASRKQTDVEVAEARRQLELERKLVAQGTRPKRAEDDAQFNLDKTIAARNRANATVSEARARLKKLERELGETAVRAPFAGTIAMQYRNAGALVGPTVPIVRLISGDALWVRFAVPPAEVDAVAVGADIEVEIDGEESRLAGTVREITPEIDPASRMIFVEAELELSDEMRDRVRSGTNAWVRL